MKIETTFFDRRDEVVITRRPGHPIDFRVGDIVVFHEIDNGTQAWRITQRWVDFYDRYEFPESNTTFISYDCERFNP